jgi:DNA-binding MarR family transcriptional regulator
MTVDNPTSMDDAGRLECLAQALGCITEITGSRVAVEAVKVLLHVASNPPLTVTDIAKATGQPLNTASRQLLDLGTKNRNLQPGWGLIEPVQDAADLRSRSYRLTEKGQELVARILGRLRELGGDRGARPMPFPELLAVTEKAEAVILTAEREMLAAQRQIELSPSPGDQIPALLAMAGSQSQVLMEMGQLVIRLARELAKQHQAETPDEKQG